MTDLPRLLNEALKTSRISKAEIARRLGVSPQAVTGWLKTGRIGKQTLRRFAEETGANLSQLMGGEGNTSSADDLTYVRVPLISWVQAGKKNPVSDPHPPGYPEEWEETSVSVSKGTFALRVRGDSMVAPDGSGFPEGSLLIVDPDIEARNGDLVVVRFQDSDDATFKKLVVDGPMKILRALNPAYPSIPITEDARLAGVVVEIRPPAWRRTQGRAP